MLQFRLGLHWYGFLFLKTDLASKEYSNKHIMYYSKNIYFSYLFFENELVEVSEKKNLLSARTPKKALPLVSQGSERNTLLSFDARSKCSFVNENEIQDGATDIEGYEKEVTFYHLYIDLIYS